MAKKKATKTVMAKVAVAFNDKGHYDVCGAWIGGQRPTNTSLTRDIRQWDTDPYLCIVDIELEIPAPPCGKVVEVKQVKP